VNISNDDPRIIRLDAYVRELGLTNEGVLSCLFHVVHAYCGERGRQAIAQLRDEHEFEVFTFEFDAFADAVGVTPTHLFDLLETGIVTFGPKFATTKRETLQ
jgi:hypothetical protein